MKKDHIGFIKSERVWLRKGHVVPQGVESKSCHACLAHLEFSAIHFAKLNEKSHKQTEPQTNRQPLTCAVLIKTPRVLPGVSGISGQYRYWRKSLKGY
jgi:hypothetical protein